MINVEFLPYALLAGAILAGWRFGRLPSLTLLAVATLSGLLFDRLHIAAFPILLLHGIAAWASQNLSLSKIQRITALFAVLTLSLAMFNYLAPGFNNLMIYNQVRFTPDAIPFSMFLNFDKAAAGLLLYLFVIKSREAKSLNVPMMVSVFALLVATLLPLALALNYVKFEFKFPEHAVLWMLNNLLFVCLAEEALFRGVIQSQLVNLLPKGRLWEVIAVLAASLLFGLAHYKGGPAYILLAAVAGVYYGFAYQRSARLEAPMLIHFGLNSVHFLFFTYPSLA